MKGRYNNAIPWQTCRVPSSPKQIWCSLFLPLSECLFSIPLHSRVHYRSSHGDSSSLSLCPIRSQTVVIYGNLTCLIVFMVTQIIFIFSFWIQREWSIKDSWNIFRWRILTVEGGLVFCARLSCRVPPPPFLPFPEFPRCESPFAPTLSDDTETTHSVGWIILNENKQGGCGKERKEKERFEKKEIKRERNFKSKQENNSIEKISLFNNVAFNEHFSTHISKFFLGHQKQQKIKIQFSKIPEVFRGFPLANFRLFRRMRSSIYWFSIFIWFLANFHLKWNFAENHMNVKDLVAIGNRTHFHSLWFQQI